MSTLNELMEKSLYDMPWELVDTIDGGEWYIRIRDPNGATIIWCNPGALDDGDAATFGLIVRSVNAIGPLVEALKAAIPCLEDWISTTGFGEIHERDKAALGAIRAALKLAKGGQP
jgi:hypothetical protein